PERKPEQSFGEIYRNLEDPPSKQNYLQQQIIGLVRSILRLDGNEDLDYNTDLGSLGIDSLMYAELWNSLNKLLRNENEKCSTFIHPDIVKECETVGQLVCEMEKLISKL